MLCVKALVFFGGDGGIRTHGTKKVQLISSSCHTGSLCPSLSLISANFPQLVTALLPIPRKMHGFLKAKGTGGHYFVCSMIILFRDIHAFRRFQVNTKKQTPEF